ncbi:MAG: preprotein translocase subunit YajC [Deltaproteobacteria bacterium]|nr:preprotein translocase subunit YajC [Deltaproteobacteria bacterium]
MFTNIAYAQEGAAQPAAFQSIAGILPLVLIFVIFYFLLIRPQQKKAREHREMLSKLEKNDMVVTSGGICGKITGVAEDSVTVEIADNVKVKVMKEHIVNRKK